MNATLSAMINSFEKERQVAYKRYKIMLALGWPFLAAAPIFAIVAFSQGWGEWSYAIVGILFIAGVVFLIIGYASKANFVNKVASRLQAEVNAELFPNAQYSPDTGFTLEKTMYPGFFEEPDRYFTRGYMTASYQGIQFERAHYQLQRRERHTDKNGNVYYTYSDYAVGTMYHFIYGRDFGAIVKVLEKSGWQPNNSGLTKKETEWIVFNKKFNVYTSDETLVFYLLTPQIQEKIIDLEPKTKGQFYMAFIDQSLFIAVNDWDKSIEIPFRKPLTPESAQGLIEAMAIPAVFITLLGLTKTKFEANAGVNYKPN